ncbi:MAG: hypothetical protein LBM38_04920 [Clostridiales bacterium]|jgi:hypothetical protein|nr:hypothetical protein [Clostridiales bacterium]
MSKILVICILTIAFGFYPSNTLKDSDYDYFTTASDYYSYKVNIHESLPELNVEISQIKDRVDGLVLYSINFNAPGFSQTIIEESWFHINDMLVFEDWNFDGYRDLVIKVENTKHGSIKKFWFWSGSKFVEHPQLNDINMGAFSFIEDKFIVIQTKHYPNGWKSLYYSIEDYELILQKYRLWEVILGEDCIAFDDKQREIIKERINGKMIITKNVISDYKSE